MTRCVSPSQAAVAAAAPAGEEPAAEGDAVRGARAALAFLVVTAWLPAARAIPEADYAAQRSTVVQPWYEANRVMDAVVAPDGVHLSGNEAIDALAAFTRAEVAKAVQALQGRHHVLVPAGQLGRPVVRQAVAGRLGVRHLDIIAGQFLPAQGLGRHECALQKLNLNHLYSLHLLSAYMVHG